MTISITNSNTEKQSDSKNNTKLGDYLKTNGRYPQARISVTSIYTGNSIQINQFESYRFSSSIIIPVDVFSITMSFPNNFGDTSKVIREGDLCYFQANGRNVFCGIAGPYRSQTDGRTTKKILISGRNLMSQLEDNDAISIDSKALYAQNITLEGVLNSLIANTRISSFEIRNNNTSIDLFATSPGESKLSALQRYLYPQNVLAWTDGFGKIIVATPNYNQKSKGKFFINREDEDSNVIDISVSRDSTRIPNVVVPVWSGLEGFVGNITGFQPFYNKAETPSLLYAYGHRVIRTEVQSIPSGSSPGDLANLNLLQNNANNYMQNFANRFLARENFRELIVDLLVAGHYNDDMEPYVVDTIYNITDPTEGIIGLDMYLFEVEYMMEKGKGQRTKLRFCKLYTICSGGALK